MTKKTVTPVRSKEIKYFHEVIEEDQKNIGYRIKDVKATQKRKTRDREKKEKK